MRTRILVKQDRRTRKVTFQLLDSDVFKEFNGIWEVVSYSPQNR